MNRCSRISLVFLLFLAGPPPPTAFGFTTAPFPPLQPIRLSRARDSPSLCTTRTTTRLRASSMSSSSSIKKDFKIAIVGGGPSGLLLAHALLNKLNATTTSATTTTVDVFEKSPRPGSSRFCDSYALGLGMRGRTAISSAGDVDDKDDVLWGAVSRYGSPSERFILHLGPIPIKLRTGPDPSEESDKYEKSNPSLLIFQSDICRALVEELNAKWSTSGRLQLNFDRAISKLDLQTNTLTTSSTHPSTKQDKETSSSSSSSSQRYDLVVGCDGADSIVRKAMAKTWSGFETTTEPLQRFFKVVRLSSMPPLLDPTAVQLLLPKKVKDIANSTSIKAFIVPTANQSCSLLFLSEKNETDLLFTATSETCDKSTLAQLLEARYPKLVGANLESVAQRLLESSVRQPAHVQCNIYHYRDKAVLIGDAAHGGVEQGLNAALGECVLLADCLADHCCNTKSSSSLHAALLAYSQTAVPQGKALDDLSFGPQSTLGKVRFQLKSVRDAVFKGKFGLGEKMSLHNKLTTSVQPFTEIRTAMNRYFDNDFPDEKYWMDVLAKLDRESIETSRTGTTKQ